MASSDSLASGSSRTIPQQRLLHRMLLGANASSRAPFQSINQGNGAVEGKGLDLYLVFIFFLGMKLKKNICVFVFEVFGVLKSLRGHSSVQHARCQWPLRSASVELCLGAASLPLRGDRRLTCTSSARKAEARLKKSTLKDVTLAFRH